MKKPARIAIVVDNPFRDLPGHVLVASRLCRAGATCYLVPFNLQNRELSALAPDFVLLSFLRPPNHLFVRRLVDAGIQIGVLDGEGGVHSSLEHYGQLTSPDRDLFKHVACFCSWGPKVAAFAIEQQWYKPAQVVVTGAPRFDFYAPDWRDVVLRTSSPAREFSAPLVLICGRFPTANPAFTTAERTIKGWEELGFDRAAMLHYQRIEHQAMLEMAALANQLAARFPEVTFVYRPHPFERLETYLDLLEPRSNLHLVKQGTVQGWILRASALIHRISTTAIEARMAGRPALSPAWINVPEEIPSTEDVSVQCATLDELSERLAAIVCGRWTETPNLAEAADRVIQDWFHVIDGAAHERVAATILRCADRNGSSVRLGVCRDLHYRPLKETGTIKQRVGQALRISFRVPATWSFSGWRHSTETTDWWDYSKKAFGVGDVRALLEGIANGEADLEVGIAAERRDYRLPYRTGRSIVMHAT